MTSLSKLDTDHQLEKLEFALASSQTKGDKINSDKIIEKIKTLV